MGFLPAAVQLFTEQVPVSIALFDAQMRYLAVSRHFLSDMEFLFSTRACSPAEAVGCSHYALFPKMPLRWRAIHARVLAGEELAEQEDWVRRQDGCADCIRWSMKPWRNVSGEIGGALCFCEVITEHVEMRRALAESELLFRSTFENAAVGIAHLNSDHRWIRANEALCRMLGWPIDELVTKSLKDISHPGDFAQELGYLQQMHEGAIDSYRMDKRYMRKNGGIVWGGLTVSAVHRGDGSIDYFVGVIEDISARKRAEEELAESESQLRATFENAAVGIAHAAPDGKMLRLNKAMSCILGWPADELINRSFHDITQPDDLAQELVYMQQMHQGVIDNYVMEKRFVRKDGATIWGKTAVSAVHRDDGSIDYFVCVIEDISARKRAEEQVHLLMREATHRVKNLLGLVQAIARRTAAGSVDEFVGRFTQRIQALSANQDLLGRNGRKGVDLGDLVCAQLAHFADLVGTRITVRGPKLHLNANAAQAIGLALHELATNAAKYGALSTEVGRVDLGWWLGGDSLTLTWLERGGPPAQPPDHWGFGTTVLDVMARQALGGEVRLDYARSGLEWRVTCPAVNALEPEMEHP